MWETPDPYLTPQSVELKKTHLTHSPNLIVKHKQQDSKDALDFPEKKPGILNRFFSTKLNQERTNSDRQKSVAKFV